MPFEPDRALGIEEAGGPCRQRVLRSSRSERWRLATDLGGGPIELFALGLAEPWPHQRARLVDDSVPLRVPLLEGATRVPVDQTDVADRVANPEVKRTGHILPVWPLHPLALSSLPTTP